MSRLEEKGIYETRSATDVGFHPNRQAELIQAELLCCYNTTKQHLGSADLIQTGSPLFSKGWGLLWMSGLSVVA